MRAFAGGEYLPPENIPELTILAAEERYLLPIAGRQLCQRLAEGGYPELKEEFVAPALALCVKRLLLDSLRIQIGACGLAAAATQGWHEASAEAVGEARKNLLTEMRSLLCRLSDELERRRDEIPEYDSDKNIMNRCRIYGDIVQTF